MDHTDCLILSCLQDGLPLEPTPYATLARDIGLAEEELLSRIRELKRRGVIRRIGPVIEPGALSRATTLAAMAVPEKQIEKVAAIVSALAGVSHNYLRQAEGKPVPYNLWFTLSAPSRDALDKTLSKVCEQTGLDVMSLPAKRAFKLHVRFETGDSTGDCHRYRQLHDADGY